MPRLHERLLRSAAPAAFAIMAGALGALAGAAHAQEGPPPGTKPNFEKRSYIKGMTLLGHTFVGEERGGKMQMMIQGDRRYLVQTSFGHPGGWIIDVSNPLKPVVINSKAFPDGENFQVAWRADLKKWVCMVTLQKNKLDTPGLRGVEFWDITDPANTKLLSSWAVDGGDPSRTLQEGSGPHRSYYDGGRYAYLSTSSDNDFYLTDAGRAGYQNHMQIIDVSDITKPKLVANWHMPGQRKDEVEARKASGPYNDPTAMNSIHGPVYVPTPIEKGGKLGYGSWGGLGMVIQDLSDPANPKLVSNWVPPSVGGRGLAVHTIDVTRLYRNFVIVTPEEFGAGCNTPRMHSYILDVKDPSKPTVISELPFPTPPPEAPYKSFCGRYGRFGAHNMPHLKAPGKANPNFTCYSWFAAGLQCFDITDPKRPAIVSYFLPEQGASDGVQAHGIRTVDDVFIEWDRGLIWIATDTGNYLLSAPQLGKPVLKPMAEKEWNLPGLNQGHP